MQMNLRLIRRVHLLFEKSGLKLSVAESCTGGLIGHGLTQIPGASGFFEAAVVAYSASAKQRILGISQATVRRHGVISSTVAAAMARAVRRISGSDYAVSTTGNLGPDVLEGKARGLVFVAVSRKEGTVVREYHFRGNREENKVKAAERCLALLAATVQNDRATR